MARDLITRQTILAVFPFPEDRISLQTILGRSNWEVQFTATFDEAREALRAFSFGVVISESRLPEGLGWKDLLREIQDAAESPPLIVVDRLADEWLWAEVLNLGAYGVLMKPFDAKEVLHAIVTACDFCGTNDG
jgi:DNA-binding response OmpR family regulator